MTKLILASLIPIVLLSQTSARSRPSPADILRSAADALEKIESLEYEVRREYPPSTTRKVSGRTKILATRTPFRFSAGFQADGKKEMAVSDGVRIRVSHGGKTEESPEVFASDYADEKPMRIMGDATLDVAGTWRVLFDPAYLKQIATSPNVVYVKQEDIEGDLCHVVLVVRDSQLFESITSYFWVSSKTSLPRAVQSIRLTRGRTNVTPRFIMSNMRLNPPIPSDEVFSYRPTAADSTSAPAPALPSLATALALPGIHLPDLEVRDTNYRVLKLSDLTGTPTVLNFWAPWCAPCIVEFPVLQKLQDEYKGGLRIVTVAVQDARLNVLTFVKKNPQYTFTFLTDVDLPDQDSKLVKFFAARGIPTSVFISADGQIIERWEGFDGEKALVERIQRLMRR